MVEILATHVRGLGAARGNVRLQLPGLKRYVPELKGVVEGTLNLYLDRPLRILQPDVTTDPIRWGQWR